jgi:ATP/maltotriose-dependent transcriptional regulator MalT
VEYLRGREALKDSPYLRKTVCPGLPPAILHRDALVRRLSDAIIGPASAPAGNFPYKLVLLHAPAGYGKTTLLADFSRRNILRRSLYWPRQRRSLPVNYQNLLKARF